MVKKKEENTIKLDKARVMRIIKAAIKEDLGIGDITSNSLISKLDSAKGSIIANEESVLCGITIAEWIFGAIDYSVRFKPQARDGDIVHPGEDVAFVEGHARAILASERLALNFMSLLSGIATETRKYVKKTKKYGVKILDTRKTFPLLRYLEKYAVSIAGGYNHRMNLGEMVMVKDNHLKVLDAKIDIRSLRNKLQRNVQIEVEVDNLDQFKQAVMRKPDIIMLDNMDPDDIRKAVRLRNEKPSSKNVKLEVSGGITLDNVEKYAETGVDRISIGAITDSVEGIDFSLNLI